MTTATPSTPASEESEFTATTHVYEPHRNGLPPLAPYVKELWRRREFAAELSKANMRAASSMTFFGQLWLVLNPLLLASVYFFLVQVLSARHQGFDYFAHLTAGLFTYYFVSGSLTTGAASVTSGGRILLNTNMPRLLMPLGAVRTAFFRFLPTLIVYGIFHLLARNPIGFGTLAAIPFFLMLTAFGAGLAAFFATAQVYFRDITSFLPYFVRIWLYASPVIWTIDQVPARFHQFIAFNPLYSMLGGFVEALTRAQVPSPGMWLTGIAWSSVTLVLGCLFFMSREREFAVRL